MKDAYYFSHDSNARNDEKILMLMAEHGLKGYGAYWILIEMMFENSETCLYHDKVKGIAFSYNIDITELEQIISTAISEELFVSDGTTFWSESLRRRKGRYHELKQKRSEAGKKGMAKRWGLDNKDITELKQSNNKDITNDNKGKESKVKEIYKPIVDYLNKKTGKNFRHTTVKTKDCIKARLNEGFNKDDFYKVIDIKTEEWKGDPRMENYLRPETLFSNKFEGYLNQKPVVDDELAEIRRLIGGD